MTLINFYQCSCGEEWHSEWDCACNDKCPTCNKEIEPYESQESESEHEFDQPANELVRDNGQFRMGA